MLLPFVIVSDSNADGIFHSACVYSSSYSETPVVKGKFLFVLFTCFSSIFNVVFFYV
jgi:hypothetical protein